MECKKIMRGILGVTAAAMLFCGCGRKGTGLDDKLTDYKVSGSDSISLEYMNSDDHKFVTIVRHYVGDNYCPYTGEVIYFK